MKINEIDINQLMIKTYNNPHELKGIIYKENKNKSGIYCWYNISNSNFYVGSTIDINNRLSQYLSYKYLKQKPNSIIYKVLLKYGYSNFNFCILKYCEKKELLRWEQHYLDLLQPNYNILKVAKSSLGYKHSTKNLIQIRKLNCTNNGHLTIVINKDNNLIYKYDCLKDAARSLNLHPSTLLKYYIKPGKMYNNYLIIRLIKIKQLIFDFEKKLPLNVKCRTISNIVKPLFTIKVQEIQTNNIKHFASIRKAAIFLKVHHSYIAKCLSKNEYYKNQNYFITKNYLS